MTLRRVRITSRRTDGCRETTINDRRIDANNIYRAASSPDKLAKLRYELSLSAATSNETPTLDRRRAILNARSRRHSIANEAQRRLATIYEEIKKARRYPKRKGFCLASYLLPRRKPEILSFFYVGKFGYF